MGANFLATSITTDSWTIYLGTGGPDTAQWLPTRCFATTQENTLRILLRLSAPGNFTRPRYRLRRPRNSGHEDILLNSGGATPVIARDGYDSVFNPGKPTNQSIIVLPGLKTIVESVRAITGRGTARIEKDILMATISEVAKAIPWPL